MLKASTFSFTHEKTFLKKLKIWKAKNLNVKEKFKTVFSFWGNNLLPWKIILKLNFPLSYLRLSFSLTSLLFPRYFQVLVNLPCYFVWAHVTVNYLLPTLNFWVKSNNKLLLNFAFIFTVTKGIKHNEKKYLEKAVTYQYHPVLRAIWFTSQSKMNQLVTHILNYGEKYEFYSSSLPS